jgi:hypothetical protein
MRVAMTATVVALVLAAEVPSAEAAGNPETVGGQLGALVETVTAPVLPELSPPTSAQLSVPPVAAEPSAPPPTPDPPPVSTAAAPSPVVRPQEAAGAGVAAPRGGGDPAAPLAAADTRPQSVGAAAHAGASRGKGRAPTATRRPPRAESSRSPSTALAAGPPRQVFPTADPHPGLGLAPIVADLEPGAPLPAFAFYAALVAALGSLWLASRRSLGIRADRDRWRL